MEDAVNGSSGSSGGLDPLLDLMSFPHRYTKEELLEIKERPFSKRRPPCLSEKYDSEGVWDPEKWHASLYPPSGRTSPLEGAKKDPEASLGRRAGADPRERLKQEEDLEVVLSPQRRSFGGGCHVTAPSAPGPAPLASASPLASGSRRSGSPLDKEGERLLLGGRRIGSGRLLANNAANNSSASTASSRALEGKEREHHKEKRFRRDFGEGKRAFGGEPPHPPPHHPPHPRRHRHDSYTEEEPEWFSGGPTSQSETIELIGFDDKILEEEHKGRKRARRRNAPPLKEGMECNGGLAEEEGGRRQEVSVSEQEVPPPREEFDFNEFFNLDKSVPGLASMIEDVLGEGSVSSSRFSRWFSNPSHSGSRSSSLRSTPHEELERLAGLSPLSGSGGGAFFAPIPVEGLEVGPGAGGRGLGPGGGASGCCCEGPEVDILEMLHKAKVDLRPLLSSLSANQETLRQSTHSGVVLSVEEVEAGLKGLKMEPEAQAAQHALASRRFQDGGGGGGDMSAFNRLVSSMKASGTLPSQQLVAKGQQPSLESQGIATAAPEMATKNILQEILGGPGSRPPPPPPPASCSSSNVLSALMGGLETTPAAPSPAAILAQRGPWPPHPPPPPSSSSSSPPPPAPPQPPPIFPTRAAPSSSSADYLRQRIPSPVGFGPSVPPPLLADPFHPGVRKNLSPAAAQLGALGLPPGALEGFSSFLPELTAAMTLSGLYQPALGTTCGSGSKAPLEKGRDPGLRNRQPRMAKSPSGALGPRPNAASPPANAAASVTSMLSPSFTPTSVIRKMYESKDKGKEENGKTKADNDGDEPSVDPEAPSPGARLPPRGSAPFCPSSLRCPQEAAKASCGRKTPRAESPAPGPFLRQAPPPALPAPPALPPGLLQRMLAQGLHPQHLPPPPPPPPLLQAGLLAPGVDLAFLGQPCYPLLNPRRGGALQLAMMQHQQHQQQLQRSGSALRCSASSSPSSPLPPSASSTSQAHLLLRSGGGGVGGGASGGGGPPPGGLSRWFGSEVLQQPLPSMPSSKVISVDELEFRP